MENLRSMPSASRSGSEEELREHKDEELSDEEESEVFPYFSGGFALHCISAFN